MNEYAACFWPIRRKNETNRELVSVRFPALFFSFIALLAFAIIGTVSFVGKEKLNISVYWSILFGLNRIF